MSKMNTVRAICACVFAVLVCAVQAESSERRDVTFDKRIPHSPRGVKNIERNRRDILPRSNGNHYMCPKPKRPENGYLFGEVIGVGGVIEVRCNNGYMLDGPAKMTCVQGKDGPVWSPDVSRSCLAANSNQPSLRSAPLDKLQDTEPGKRQNILVEQNVKREIHETTSPDLHMLPARCLHKPEAGPCDAFIKRYYFKESTMECHTFLYRGCEGNANNFKTMDECNQACRGHE